MTTEMPENHCRDCCCARSWKALGISAYTGKSIPEHIKILTAKLAAAEKMAGALEMYADGGNINPSFAKEALAEWEKVK